MAQFENEFKQLIYEMVDERRQQLTKIAKTGRLLDNGTLQRPSVGAEPGKAWVTLGDDHAIQVWGIQRIKDEANITVELFPNINGELRIDAILESETVRTFGSGAASLSVPDRAANLIREVVNTRRLEHMRIRASTPQALTVYVPAGYYDWQGVLRFWSGGSITITATATSNKHRMTLVTLNRSTGLLAVTNGDDFGTVQSIGEAQLAAISVGAEHLRLGGARVANGQTTITENDIVEARVIVGQWQGFNTFFPTIDGEMTIASGQRASWYGKIIITGKFVIEGDLRIAA